MKDELQAWETELATIDDSRLPKVLGDKMTSLAKVNQKFEEAQNKKLLAQKRIDEVLDAADEEIKKAAKVGGNKAKTHKFVVEYTTKGDRITAIEQNLKELIEFSADGAKYEKQLAEVMGAVVESQTAVMEVVKCQSEYLDSTANALKFLYGLSAYSIASTQSIVTNLEAVLSGAKKKDLGEMAKQQMYLVMDQLKSQENLNSRMKKNEDKIADIKRELKKKTDIDAEHDKRLADGEAKDRKQDQLIKKQAETGKEHDRLIREGIERDEAQDAAIAEGIEKDTEQDSKIEENRTKNEDQDRILEEQQLKDSEHDRRLDEGDRHDIQQDEIINQLNTLVEKNKREIGGLLDEVYSLGEVRERVNKIEETTKYMATKKQFYIIGAIGIISMILSVLHFVI